MTEQQAGLSRTDFPDNFIWGTATASYQIEGAVEEDGRGPSIWDTFSHTPGKTSNGDTGDVADNHYHLYRRDVALMRQIGLNGYRFSISWPRILPEGRGQINQKGLDFYNRLVDELASNNILPFATLYHWDLPQALQDKGGWANRDTAKYFADYADKVSRKLGDRVKGWITLNEPWVAAVLGNLTGEHAPGLSSMETTVRAAHHLLLGHGLALPVLRENSQRADAEFGATLSFNYVEPGDDHSEELAILKDAWDNRFFLDPLFKKNYPEELAGIINQYLPVEPGDMDIIGTPVDFLGVNYYFRTLPVAYEDKAKLTFKQRKNPGSQYTAMGWEVYPEGLRNLLVRFHKDYNVPKLYVTENGAAFEDRLQQDQSGAVVHDPDRLNYLRDHFEAARQAIKDGAPLAGYFVWSLLDNFEWAHGYSKRFGIVYVDYQNQQRVLKDSGKWLQQFLEK
ncbi:MAG TPA: GH1 family beta-glucosidase [Chloroflexia bacterium]|nr:GH1 family beta-glucosidase [Chloroflexia bacterium]